MNAGFSVHQMNDVHFFAESDVLFLLGISKLIRDERNNQPIFDTNLF